VRCRELQPGESLASFVQWHCTHNVLPRLSTLFGLLARTGGAPVRAVHELAQSPACLRALERVTRQPAGALAHLQRKVLRAAVEDGYEDRLVDGDYEWPQHARARHLQAVCPSCLLESGYALASWEYVQAPVCLRHKVRLVDRCGDCGTSIKLDRKRLLACESCGHLLGRARVTPVDDQQLEAARRVQAAKTLAFGKPEDNLPIEPSDLSGLLRLLLRPLPGQSVAWGLTGDLEALTVERRLDALRRLGQTLAGSRVDSGRLRNEALGRWVYAPLLPESECVRLLREACETVALPPDVTAMLCWDREAPPLQMAMELFERDALPRILDLPQLGQRLGLSREDLRTLMAEESVSETKPKGYGFDMDEVLRLERALAEMLTLEDADRMLGWPGLAAELVSMRLVLGVTRASGEKALHPRSVTRLFEYMHERVTTAATRASTAVPLAAVASSRGLDARQVAWALRQVIGGSLPAYGWEEPFHLTSVRVRSEELEPVPADSASPC
jgi:DNA-directed RNA polymerase subunit RPC12/RpoP